MKKRFILTICCLMSLIIALSMTPAFAAEADPSEYSGEYYEAGEILPRAWRYYEDAEVELLIVRSSNGTFEYPDKIWYEKPLSIPGYTATGWLYQYGIATIPDGDSIYVFYRGEIACFIF